MKKRKPPPRSAPPTVWRPPPVLSKSDFAVRYQRNEFGNASPTWDNITEFLRAKYTGPIHIRNRLPGEETWYNIPAGRVLEVYNRILDAGKYREQDLYFSAMCPTEKTLFQGEVQRSKNYLDLTYTTVAKPMRDALREQTLHASGIGAWCLLRTYLCPNSYDWLQQLFDNYPDHVVEFTTLSTEWGTIPGYNTIFWECRAY